MTRAIIGWSVSGTVPAAGLAKGEMQIPLASAKTAHSRALGRCLMEHYFDLVTSLVGYTSQRGNWNTDREKLSI